MLIIKETFSLNGGKHQATVTHRHNVALDKGESTECKVQLDQRENVC